MINDNQVINTIQQLNNEKIINYTDYWNSVKPKNDTEYHHRWVFSFLSVHTSWTSNVHAYNVLMNEYDNWHEDYDKLKEVIIKSRVGIYNNRTKGIWGFHQSFWENPKEWTKASNETWFDCRDRLMEKCFNLGKAKVAFALELCDPLACEVTCLDTHMLQLYGYTTQKEMAKANKGKTYDTIEQNWVEQCKSRNVPSYIARCLFWDAKQGRENSRYWSKCLEP